MEPSPSIGRIVHFCVPAEVARMINSIRDQKPESGSRVKIGEKLPMIITRVHTDTVVNGKIIIDGKGDLWTQACEKGNLPGQWNWPEIIRVYNSIESRN